MEASGITLLTLVLLCAAGFPLRALLLKVHVPPAVSLMALGILVGSSVLAILPEAWTASQTVLSQAAFVVLLLRAGFGLPPGGLRAVLLPALVFGTLPVLAELIALFGLGRVLLFERLDTALLCAFLIAAVSPAVILPAMLNQKDLGRGSERLVPDRIMGQTVVNAFIAQTGILILVDVVCPPSGGMDVAVSLIRLPLNLAAGLALGIAAGFLICLGLKSLCSPGSGKPGPTRIHVIALVLLGAALAVFFGCQNLGLETVFATLAVGVLLRRGLDPHEPVLRVELRRFWLVAEIVLFVSLGAQVDLAKLGDLSLVGLLSGMIVAAVGLRIVVVWLLSRRTALSRNERRYSAAAHVPKATIQAVFGAYPLMVFTRLRPGDAELLDAGGTMLVMAVVAIVATAPIGAVLLDRLGQRWLGAADTVPDVS